MYVCTYVHMYVYVSYLSFGEILRIPISICTRTDTYLFTKLYSQQ